jgi:Ca-activated chloride channel family protein
MIQGSGFKMLLLTVKQNLFRTFLLVLLINILVVSSIASRKQESNSAQGQDDKAQKTRSYKPSNQKIHLNTRLVNVTVTVTDTYGRFVTGLQKEHFQVYDDKIEQDIAHFSDEDTPVSLGIVYDVSGSMKSRVARSYDSLMRFFETSHQDDDFFLIAFNDRPALVQDFTTSADQLLGRLMFVDAKKSTALYDAAYLAVEKVRQGRHSKKALLLISDGQDNNSRYSYKELRNRVKEADVLIYAIGITDPYNDSLAGMGRSVLEEITRMTGGRAFFPNANSRFELTEICARIALELRHQYSIGFYPTDTEKNTKWHKVKIKVNRPKGIGRLSLSYKDGYTSFYEN